MPVLAAREGHELRLSVEMPVVYYARGISTRFMSQLSLGGMGERFTCANTEMFGWVLLKACSFFLNINPQVVC